MEQKTILVVEDERPLLEVIKIKLEKMGFAVVTARSVEEATKQLSEVESVSAIWLDHYLLGKENGLDCVALCKDDDATRDVPIFVVSNTVTEDKVQAYLKLGVNSYHVKAQKRLDDIIEEISEAIHE